MHDSAKREISKSGTPIETTRIDSAFDVLCCHCGRQGEARSISIELPKALGKQPITYTRLPDGWFVQAPIFLTVTAACPSCMEEAPGLPGASYSTIASAASIPPVSTTPVPAPVPVPVPVAEPAPMDIEPSLAELLFPPPMRPVLTAFIQFRHAVRHREDGYRLERSRVDLLDALIRLQSDEIPGLVEATARLMDGPEEAFTPAFADALVPLLFEAKGREPLAPPRFDRHEPVTGHLRRALDDALEQLDNPRSLRAHLERERIRQALDANQSILEKQHRVLEAALAIPPDALQALLASPDEPVRAWARATIDATESGGTPSNRH